MRTRKVAEICNFSLRYVEIVCIPISVCCVHMAFDKYILITKM